MPIFVFLSIGLHEEVDRRVSQNSLGDMTKLGSKTALNRRVRRIFSLNRDTGKIFFSFLLFCFVFPLTFSIIATWKTYQTILMKFL